jgi:hypothetical protein
VIEIVVAPVDETQQPVVDIERHGEPAFSAPSHAALRGTDKALERGRLARLDVSAGELGDRQ